MNSGFDRGFCSKGTAVFKFEFMLEFIFEAMLELRLEFNTEFSQCEAILVGVSTRSLRSSS